MPAQGDWIEVEKLRWSADLGVEVRVGDGDFEDLQPLVQTGLGKVFGPVNRACPVPADQGCGCDVTAVRAKGDGVEVKLKDGEVLSLEDLLGLPTSGH